MSTVEISPEQVGQDAPQSPAEPTVAQPPEGVPEKFWDAAKGEVRVDTLVASYKNLESKLGQPQSEEPSQDTPPETQDSDTTEQAPAEDQQAQDALEAAGLKLDDFTQEFVDKGELSTDSYKKLEEAGFPKELVDVYVDGLLARNGQQEAELVLAERDVQDIKQSVFKGVPAVEAEQRFSDMIEWSSQNLQQAELSKYNEMVSSGDKMQAQVALEWLHGRYLSAEGTEPRLIGGTEAPNNAQGFQSWAEVTRAMSDSRYKTDRAYRKEIETRLSASNL